MNHTCSMRGTMNIRITRRMDKTCSTLIIREIVRCTAVTIHATQPSGMWGFRPNRFKVSVPYIQCCKYFWQTATMEQCLTMQSMMCCDRCVCCKVAGQQNYLEAKEFIKYSINPVQAIDDGKIKHLRLWQQLPAFKRGVLRPQHSMLC